MNYFALIILQMLTVNHTIVIISTANGKLITTVNCLVCIISKIFNVIYCSKILHLTITIMSLQMKI